MSVIFLLIAIGVIVAGGFLAAFIWSVKTGQYDDDYTPSVRILFDDFNEKGGDLNDEDKNRVKSEQTTVKPNNNNKS